LLENSEDEICEYKANKSVTDNEFGEYFSALSNEANLGGVDSAWIVFGVSEKPKPHTVNSTFKDGASSINELKHFVAQHTSDNTTFNNVYEIFDGDKRILLFEVPVAKPGTPMRFKRIAYGRNGDSISPLPDIKHKRILDQVEGDWTAQIVPEATIDDYDSNAIVRARAYYKRSRPSMAEECDRMSDAEFLEAVGATKNGKVSRASLILLGKWKSDGLLTTPNMKIRWNRWENKDDYSDSEVYNIPFILAVDDIVSKIYNRKREHIVPGTTMVNKFETYDDFVLRESLHNCICHRDYSEPAYITVREL
jgi:ATP-dependent DNA helicase RecG